MYYENYVDLDWSGKTLNVQVNIYFPENVHQFFKTDEDFELAADIVTDEFVKKKCKSLSNETFEFKNNKFIWCSQIYFSEYFSDINTKDDDISFIISILNIVY